MENELYKNVNKAMISIETVENKWGSSSDVEPGNVDNYISFLRKRLRELLSCCEIKTVYGAGYRLEKKDHA